MAATAVQGPELVSGGSRGLWFAAATLAIAGAVHQLGPQTALANLVTVNAALVLAGIVLLPVIDVRAVIGEIVSEQAIFPWPRLRGLGANQAVIGFSGVAVVIGATSLRRTLPLPHCIILGTIGSLGILASHNRSAIGAVVIGLIANALFDRDRLSRFVIGGAIASVGLVAGLPQLISLLDRRGREVSSPAYYGGSDSSILTGRAELWELVISHGAVQPFTGRGNGSFAQFSAQQFEQESLIWEPAHAHSVLFELFVDQGLIGILIFAAALIVIFRSRNSWSIGSAGLLFAVLAQGLVESIYSGSPTAPVQTLAWVAAGSSLRQPTQRDFRSQEYGDALAEQQALDTKEPAAEHASG